MDTTIHFHTNEDTNITSFKIVESDINWLTLNNLNIKIDSAKTRDELIKHLMFMEFENEND